ncbi:MAG: hypothetical protein II132_02940, partial [Desulfovibrio sp.]|nr:hypothetical protein [Desulfovibrio sp.]
MKTPFADNHALLRDAVARWRREGLLRNGRDDLRPHLVGGRVRGEEVDLQRIGGQRLPAVHPQAAAVDAEAAAVSAGL